MPDHRLEAEIGATGRHTSVKMDGQDISRFIEHMTITCAPSEITRITLDCWMGQRGHISISGTFIPDETDEVPQWPEGAE
jgi:hypothetical protein